nr:MAG TPA: hypothetical protein [Caudoviricetes sp.]
MKNFMDTRHLWIKKFSDLGNRGKELFPTAR